MLVEFSVKNFKSFKERQTLSMVAAKSKGDIKDLPQNLIPVNIPGLTDTNLLKSAVIYGANASGKSNFLYAYYYLMDYIANSFSDFSPNENIERHHFLLDKTSYKVGTEFEIVFILNDVLHQYGFIVNNEFVEEEWLYVYKSSKAQTWYTRKYDYEKETYNWYLSPTYLKGEKDTIKEFTRNNTLFLSTAAQLRHKELTNIYNWFYERYFYIKWLEEKSAVTAGMIYERKLPKEKIKLFLKQADLGVSDVLIDLIELDKLDEFKNLPETQSNNILEDAENKKLLDIKFMHFNEESKFYTEFNHELESSGTINYFNLLGPYMLALSRNHVFMIDELSSSLHPALVNSLLKAFQNVDSNAQIILTTHDTTLLDRDLLRRDQIWFTEKNNRGESFLYPLIDFRPRKDESLEKGYLAGRYGAIPFISEDFQLNESEKSEKELV